MAIVNGRNKERAKHVTYAIFLSGLLAGSLLAVTEMASIRPALAAPAVDPKGDATNGDSSFDIRTFALEGDGKIVIQVYGKAGRSIPDKPEQAHTVYVYVFNTNAGTWVINAHQECHSQIECGVSEWHTEKVDVGQMNGDTCVTQIYANTERHARMDGTNAKTFVPEVSQIYSAQTAAFELQVEDPDNAPSGICIAKLTQVFDDTAS